MLWNIIIGLAFMILGYVLMPKPKREKPDEVTEMEGPVAEAGMAIPKVFGDMHVKRPNYLWWGDKRFIERNMGGRKKKS